MHQQKSSFDDMQVIDRSALNDIRGGVDLLSDTLAKGDADLTSLTWSQTIDYWSYRWDLVKNTLGWY